MAKCVVNVAAAFDLCSASIRRPKILWINSSRLPRSNCPVGTRDRSSKGARRVTKNRTGKKKPRGGNRARRKGGNIGYHQDYFAWLFDLSSYKPKGAVISTQKPHQFVCPPRFNISMCHAIRRQRRVTTNYNQNPIQLTSKREIFRLFANTVRESHLRSDLARRQPHSVQAWV